MAIRTLYGDLLARDPISTAKASVDFDDVFVSGYNKFRILLKDVQPSADGEVLVARLGNGSTYSSGASDYEWSLTGSDITGVDSASEVEDTSDAEMHLTFAGGTGNASSEKFEGDFEVMNPLSSSFYTIMQGKIINISDIPVFSGARFYGRYQTSAISQASIQFLYSIGNVASGLIEIYGVR